MKYLFIDTETNQADRITAPNLDAAWRTYIKIVYGDLRTLKAKHDLTPSEAREGLERNVLVLDESTIHEVRE